MKLSHALLATALASTSFVQAAVVVASPNSGAGKWYTGVAANDDGTPFWDNKSTDSKLTSRGGCNIGYWLESTNWLTNPAPNCNNDTFVPGDGGPGQPLAFFADASVANGGKQVGWAVSTKNGETQTTTLRLEVAGHASKNVFGYEIFDASNSSIGGKVTIYNGIDNPLTAVQKAVKLAPGQKIGFWLKDTTDNELFESNVDATLGNGLSGKFALFSEVPNNAGMLNGGKGLERYWIGVEDFKGNNPLEKWGDFQDFVASVSVVPEPSTYAALMAGVSAMLFAARRRKKA